MNNFYFNYVHNRNFLKELELADQGKHKINIQVKKHILTSQIKNIKKKIFLDIGSGRQSLSLKNLGAKKIFTIDISSSNIKRINNFIIKKKIKNIFPKKIDLNKKINLLEIFKEKVDYIYCHGVFQHLKNPEIVISNLSNFLKEKGIIQISFYRADSEKWFFVKILRKFISKNNFNIKQFKNLNFKNYLLKRFFFDDLFVDTINLYKKNDLQHYFEQQNFTYLKSYYNNKKKRIPYITHLFFQKKNNTKNYNKKIILKNLENFFFKRKQYLKIEKHINNVLSSNKSKKKQINLIYEYYRLINLYNYPLSDISLNKIYRVK